LLGHCSGNSSRQDALITVCFEQQAKAFRKAG